MRHDVLLERTPDEGHWLYGEQARSVFGGEFDRTYWYDTEEQARRAVERDLSPHGQYRDRGDGFGPNARLVRRWLGPQELIE